MWSFPTHLWSGMCHTPPARRMLLHLFDRHHSLLAKKCDCCDVGGSCSMSWCGKCASRVLETQCIDLVCITRKHGIARRTYHRDTGTDLISADDGSALRDEARHTNT